MRSGQKAIAGHEGRLAAELAALGNPTRLQRLSAFVDGAQSPVEARRMGCDASLEKVAYHVQVLHRAGLLERTGERRKRGAIEHMYRPTGRELELFDAVVLVGG